MAYTDQATLAKDATFIGRAQVAMVKAALDICAEADSVVGHQQREIFAQIVLRNNGGYDVRSALILGMVADVTIAAGSTDQNLYDRAAAIWNAFAGA